MYSISDLEQLSGVQSHTIRMWEQRYQALVPHRSAGNTRYYDDKHLIRLLNIVAINQKGLKISKICSLPDEALHHLMDSDIQQTISSDQQYEYFIAQLLKHGMDYNELKFSELLNECFKKYDIEASYQFIIYPMLVRLGLMWQKESICPAQEHFLTNIIRQKIFVAIDAFPISKSKKTWLLFLPQDEEHEMGLLFANYMLRKLNQKVIYLGPRVPSESVDQVFEANKIDYMMIFLVRMSLISETQQYIDELAKKYSEVMIYLSGNPKLIGALILPTNMFWFKTIDQFQTGIQSLSYVK